MPHEPADDERIASILGDWQARRDRGETPDPEQVLRAHPDLAGELRARFSALGALEEAVGEKPGGAGGAGAGAVHLRKVPLERYRDFKKVGQGGMGIVYWALDTELNRSVAFKVVRPDVGSEEPGATAPRAPLDLSPPGPDTPASHAFATLKARFLQEAWVTGGMEHPGIVPVYEVGETPEGVPYYTMRFVKGTRTLAQAIEETDGKPMEERLALLEPFLKVCDAVRYAHARGVIHRDLKPENVALGEFGEVVVLDWGLAKVKGEADPQADDWQAKLHELRKATDLKTVAGLLGTPGYLPPEAVRGSPQGVDERGDVYSLGAILYRILTGRLPHALSPFGEFLLNLTTTEAPAATSVEAEVPAALSRIAAEALRRDPEKRTAGVGTLAKALRTWQQRRSAQAEVEALLGVAKKNLAEAWRAEGEARVRSLDRAVASAEQVLERVPGHEGARKVRGEILALRATQSEVEGEQRGQRRRLLYGLGAVGVAGLLWAALSWRSSGYEERISGLRQENTQVRRQVAWLRAPMVATQASLEAGQGWALAARRHAAEAAAVFAEGSPWDPVEHGSGGSIGSALLATWPLWAPEARAHSPLPPEAAKDLREHPDSTAQVAWVGGDRLLLGRAWSLWRIPAQGEPQQLQVPSMERAVRLGSGQFSVSPDARWAAAASDDGQQVVVWDLGTSKVTGQFRRATDWLVGLTDADGTCRLLAADGTALLVLSPTNGETVRSLQLPKPSLTPLAAAVHGQRLYVATGEGTFALALGDGAVQATWPSWSGTSLVISEDGSRATAWGSDGWCVVWDTRTGELCSRFAIPHGSDGSALSPAGDLLVFASPEQQPVRRIDAYETVGGRWLGRASLPGKGSCPMEFAPGGDVLAVGPDVCDSGTRTSDRPLRVSKDPLVSAPEIGEPAVAVGGDRVAWLEPSGASVELVAVDLGAPAPPRRLSVDAQSVCLALEPPGRHAVVGTRDGRLLLYDLEEGRRVAERTASAAPITCVSVSDVGGVLWSVAGDSPEPQAWSLPALDPRAERAQPGGASADVDRPVRRLRSLHDGARVLVGQSGPKDNRTDNPRPLSSLRCWEASRGWTWEAAAESFDVSGLTQVDARGWNRGLLGRASDFLWFTDPETGPTPGMGNAGRGWFSTEVAVSRDATLWACAARASRGKARAPNAPSRYIVLHHELPHEYSSGPVQMLNWVLAELDLGESTDIVGMRFVADRQLFVVWTRTDVRALDLAWFTLDPAARLQAVAPAAR